MSDKRLELHIYDDLEIPQIWLWDEYNKTTVG
jgi:hypothetical protein